MKYRKIADTYVLRVDPGEDIVEGITTLASKETISFAAVNGIGACDDAEVGTYLVHEKEYKRLSLKEEVELCNLSGNISTKEGKPYIHLHAVFADQNGKTYGGHLYHAVVSGTSEIFVRVLPEVMERTVSERTGLNIWKFD